MTSETTWHGIVARVVVRSFVTQASQIRHGNRNIFESTPSRHIFFNTTSAVALNDDKGDAEYYPLSEGGNVGLYAVLGRETGLACCLAPRGSLPTDSRNYTFRSMPVTVHVHFEPIRCALPRHAIEGVGIGVSGRGERACPLRFDMCSTRAQHTTRSSPSLPLAARNGAATCATETSTSCHAAILHSCTQ